MSSDDAGELGEPRPVGGGDAGALSRSEFTDLTRAQMRRAIGGWHGAVITAIPTVVFVVVNALASLRTALYAAVGSAAVLAGYQLVRRRSAQQAVSGLIGVVIAAVIAARTGQARGYFLYGIILSFIYCAAFLASMLVRRPLVGLAWEFLDPAPRSDRRWYRRPPLLRAYQLATGAGALVFAARGIIQLILYDRDATGWLAVARIGMGLPLYLAAVAFGVVVVSRARHHLAAQEAEEAAARAADESAGGPA